MHQMAWHGIRLNPKPLRTECRRNDAQSERNKEKKKKAKKKMSNLLRKQPADWRPATGWPATIRCVYNNVDRQMARLLFVYHFKRCNVHIRNCVRLYTCVCVRARECVHVCLSARVYPIAYVSVFLIKKKEKDFFFKPSFSFLFPVIATSLVFSFTLLLGLLKYNMQCARPLLCAATHENKALRELNPRQDRHSMWRWR